MKTVRVSEPAQVENEETGVAVQISELHKHFRSLEDDNPIQELSEIFAIYLTDYPMVSISCNGYLLDPEKVISNRKEFKLPDVETDEHLYTASIEVVEWSVNTERVVYFCSDAGFPLDRVKPRFHTPGLQFSAYLKSEYISELHQDGMLSLGEMDSNLMVLYDRAQEKIKLFHRRRQSEVAQNAIEEWKNEEVYPYEGEPSSPIETAERQVFDILALNIKDSLPGFVESDRRTKKFQFRMLRQAIEKGPEELQNILKEVLDLPVKKQLELARLLKEASLSNVISASRLVSDRLKFIYGLEGMLFEPDEKKHFKERSQLHRILADNNTWVFGEEFSLTVNDQSLTEVLRQHCAPQTELVIDRPVTRSDGRRGIVDLMLTKSVPRNRPEEKEHLIVELKRPSVKIGAEEITQIKSYAFAVAEDERFRHLDTRWTFWLVANDLDPFARNETRQAGRSRGKLYQSEDQKIEIWVKTWSELIEENKSRLRFVEEALNSNIDRKKSLSFLKATYERYLSDHPSDAQEQKLESGNHEGD